MILEHIRIIVGDVVSIGHFRVSIRENPANIFFKTLKVNIKNYLAHELLITKKVSKSV